MGEGSKHLYNLDGGGELYNLDGGGEDWWWRRLGGSGCTHYIVRLPQPKTTMNNAPNYTTLKHN
ncbi:hypothetical protein Hanom_Chr16g01438581 [Helianthus anomalus]